MKRSSSERLQSYDDVAGTEDFDAPPAAALDAAPQATPDAPTAGLEAVVRALLEGLGERPERPGLRRTPARVIKSLQWLTSGYRMSPRDAIGDAIFEEDVNDVVLVKNIEFYSMCEHHLLPFFGKAHVAYLPRGRIVGLSKLPRLVGVFARRLQVQERLTNQIADAVVEVLAPAGAAVCVEAHHLCMMMRGVETQSSSTLSVATRGVFHEDARRRDEFLRMTSGPR